jgi:hypothetical protein
MGSAVMITALGRVIAVRGNSCWNCTDSDVVLTSADAASKLAARSTLFKEEVLYSLPFSPRFSWGCAATDPIM